MAITVMLVDDHEIVRYAMRTVIEDEPGMEVVGEAEDGESALEKIGEIAPEILLLDLRLPGMGGIEVCRKVRDRHPDTRVLVLTSYDDDDEVFGALSAGASGYVMKDIAPHALLDTIRSVSEGRTVLDDAVAGRLIGWRKEEPAEDTLSPREREVLGLMAKGRANKDIAGALWIEETTVKTHVGNILRKLGQKDRTQAVLEAVRRGLIEVTSKGRVPPK